MNVLMIGDDLNYQNFLIRKLAPLMDANGCNSLESATEIIKSYRFDAVLCCMPLLNKSCPYEAVAKLKKLSSDTAIVMISDNIQLHTAMELMREGLFSCFNRPFPLEQLIDTLNQICKKKTMHTVPEFKELPQQERIVLSQNRHVRGSSHIAVDMYNKMALVGPTSFSVIVYGETGTGKESVASEIARARDAAAPYIAVDCGCLSKELALSELFGHEKGSFTGAVAKKVGAFELANNGTLFLDEIGNLDYEVQGFLLRALQEKKIKRVGGTEDINVCTRIVVASNENLGEAVKAGKFREDLFHRLNEFEITVPALRMRVEDLPLFINQFIVETNIELSKNVGNPDEDALFTLLHYNWPGNIRELKNVIRRACLLCADGMPINSDCLPPEILYFEEGEIWDEEDDAPMIIRQKKPRDITLMEIEEALRITNYNKTKAAHYLGIDRKTLYNRLKDE